MKAVPPPAIPDCESCPNREFSDICELVPPSEESFGLIKRRAMYRPGQHVFYEGHVALGLYILCQGRVKLTRLNRKGQQRLVGILDSGQLLEKQAFQEQPVHQVTCEVMEPSQIYLLDRTSFLSFLKDHGDLAVKLVQVLSQEMTAVQNAADHSLPLHQLASAWQDYYWNYTSGLGSQSQKAPELFLNSSEKIWLKWRR
jgi:CRP/FNR family transcriptional regulator